MGYVVSKKQGKIFNEISQKRTWGSERPPARFARYVSK